jgi:putative oxidoreductase
MSKLEAYAPYMLSILRIVTALLFLEHGLMKLVGFPAAMGHGHLPPLILAAGIIETVGGALIALGRFTRPAAFIAAGEMAVAYFKVHIWISFWPVLNHGEPAIYFCFVFLYLVFAGPGRWSLDGKRAAASTA